MDGDVDEDDGAPAPSETKELGNDDGRPIPSAASSDSRDIPDLTQPFTHPQAASC
jgi:hypothetical protein